VIDNMGNVLSKPSDSEAIVDAKQLEYQKAVDREYEQKLQSMLESVVGKNKAIVRVSTKLDFTKVERTEEKYDPDTTAVRSEQRSSEKAGGTTPDGIPGVLSINRSQRGGAVEQRRPRKQSEYPVRSQAVRRYSPRRTH
jgi:flagellar M-ring protein FliF